MAISSFSAAPIPLLKVKRLGPSLSEFLGQQVIIEKVGGAGGNTRQNIGPAAGRKRDDHCHRPCRIGLRASET